MLDDRVCLDESAKHCVDKYKVMAVSQTSQLTYLKASGVVGFGPRTVEHSVYDAPLFMDLMYKAKAVGKNMFSVYITDYLTQGKYGSRFVLGGYILEKYAKKGETKIAWNSIVNRNYWSIHMDKCTLSFDGKKTPAHASKKSSTDMLE